MSVVIENVAPMRFFSILIAVKTSIETVVTLMTFMKIKVYEICIRKEGNFLFMN